MRLPHFCYPHTTYYTNIPSKQILLHFSQLQAHDIYFPKIHSLTEIDSSCDNVYNFPVAGNFHQVSTFRHANPWLINESLWMCDSFFGEEQAKMHSRCETEHWWSSWLIKMISSCWNFGSENNFAGVRVAPINRVNNSRQWFYIYEPYISLQRETEKVSLKSCKGLYNFWYVFGVYICIFPCVCEHVYRSMSWASTYGGQRSMFDFFLLLLFTLYFETEYFHWIQSMPFHIVWLALKCRKLSFSIPMLVLQIRAKTLSFFMTYISSNHPKLLTSGKDNTQLSYKKEILEEKPWSTRKDNCLVTKYIC